MNAVRIRLCTVGLFGALSFGCGAAQTPEAAPPQALSIAPTAFGDPAFDVSAWPVRSFDDFGLSLRLPPLPEEGPDEAVTGSVNCGPGPAEFFPALNTHYENGIVCSVRFPDNGGGARLTAADLPLSKTIGRSFPELCREFGTMGLFNANACDNPPVNGAIRFGFHPNEASHPADQGAVAGEFRVIGNRLIAVFVGVAGQPSQFPTFANAFFDSITLPAQLPRNGLPTTWTPLFTESTAPVRINMPEGTRPEESGNPMVGLVDHRWAWDSVESRARFDFNAFLSPFGNGLEPNDAAAYKRKLEEQCTAMNATVNCHVADNAQGWPYIDSTTEIAPGFFRRERAFFANGSGWIAGATGPRPVMEDSATMRFFNSFELVRTQTNRVQHRPHGRPGRR